MARPKASSEETPARQRVTEAFWAMLAAGPYEKITVRALAKKANVSPNTLYYHFSCVEDVARSALDEVVDEDLARAILQMNAGAGQEALRPLLSRDAERFARVRLFASCGSGKLSPMLVQKLESTWLHAAGIGASALSVEERCDLAFIFGGAIALLGSDQAANPIGLSSMFARPLGRGIAQTMERLDSGA